jgi:hypothetical protein
LKAEQTDGGRHGQFEKVARTYKGRGAGYAVGDFEFPV